MRLQGTDSMPLVICSKSRWLPAIRREHSLAMLAAAHGHQVTFIERPLDVRALRRASGAREWWRGLRGTPKETGPPSNLDLVPQATILPGHLNAPAEIMSNLLLRRLLRRVSQNGAVVINVPWQWPAITHAGGRRVFDCADDWSSVVAHRSTRIRQLYRQIGREADAIIVATPSLTEYFPADRTTVVRNGVSDDMLGPLAPAVKAPRLVHAGTLTPRFDAQLAAGVLDLLPDWTLDLYGQSQYPGSQERPGPELSRLLSDYAARIRWHGVLPREELSAALDRAAVTLALNRPELSIGQDSMKLYDYAARGRPTVATRFSAELDEDGPPHLRIAESAREMADAILASRCEPESCAGDRRRWAEEQRWISRWPGWSEAVFGATP
jgi:hypothetical protein